MWGKCVLGKWMVNICNLWSHCLFIFGHPMFLVDSISECIARCVSEMHILSLGCSQVSFCFLLTAVLAAWGWALLLPVLPARRGACCSSPGSWLQLGLRPPCSMHGFLSWMALAAWLLSGPHFYLVSWPACPGKLPSPGRLVKLSGWPALSSLPFPFLPFAHMVSAGSHCLSLLSVPPTHFLHLLWSIPSLLPSCFSSLCSFAVLLLCILVSFTLVPWRIFALAFPYLRAVCIFSRARCLSPVCSSDLAATLFGTVTNRTLIRVTGWRNCYIYHFLFTVDIFVGL